MRFANVLSRYSIKLSNEIEIIIFNIHANPAFFVLLLRSENLKFGTFHKKSKLQYVIDSDNANQFRIKTNLINYLI